MVYLKNYIEITQRSQKELIFVDVATLSSGSIFAIGENMVQRSIVAKNIVQCLEIPTFWLLDRSQNIGNIWLRYFAQAMMRWKILLKF